MRGVKKLCSNLCSLRVWISEIKSFKCMLWATTCNEAPEDVTTVSWQKSAPQVTSLRYPPIFYYSGDFDCRDSRLTECGSSLERPPLQSIVESQLSLEEAVGLFGQGLRFLRWALRALEGDPSEWGWRTTESTKLDNVKLRPSPRTLFHRLWIILAKRERRINSQVQQMDSQGCILVTMTPTLGNFSLS